MSYCDFKPGDEVTPTGYLPDHIPYGTGRGLERGAVYVVEEVGFVHPFAVIRLVGFPNTVRADGFYAACAFRKIQRRDLSAWLETATDFEEPKRAPKKERVS